MSRNRCKTECECGTEFPATAFNPMTEDQYLEAIDWIDCPYRGNQGHGWSHGPGPRVETRFAHHRCWCGRQFSLWCEPSAVLAKHEWSVFDSSFFRAFNDEPADSDGPTLQVRLKEAEDRVRSVESELSRLRYAVGKAIES